MDIQTLVAKTGLSRRKLRYVIDHGVVPGLLVRPDFETVGRARQFPDVDGWLIACAAVLLDAGLTRAAAHEFLNYFKAATWPKGKQKGNAILNDVFFSPSSAILSVGDGVNLLVAVGDYETGWFQPSTSALLDGSYRPRVVVSIDIGRFRDQLRNP